jgi:aminopeptidase N
MVRDADLAARRYVDIVLNNVSGETSIVVVGDLLGRIGGAIDIYGDPSNRPLQWTTVASNARAFFDDAAPGSDFQLAWARAFIGAAANDDDIGFVRGLLDGSASVDGLEVDTDLRWSIVASLAMSGHGDDALISAELERDPTDDGERHAAAARASRPTAEAKAETWDRVMNDTELSLAMLRALSAGFNRPDQEELLRPYADRYFDEVLRFWERRELDLGLAFTGGFFPKLYTQDVLDRADALLAGDPPKPVRRIVTEQHFESARTMRARAADR